MISQNRCFFPSIRWSSIHKNWYQFKYSFFKYSLFTCIYLTDIVTKKLNRWTAYNAKLPFIQNTERINLAHVSLTYTTCQYINWTLIPDRSDKAHIFTPVFPSRKTCLRLLGIYLSSTNCTRKKVCITNLAQYCSNWQCQFGIKIAETKQ